MQYLVMTRTQTYFFCQIVGQKKLLSPGTELNALILPKVRITQMLNVLASRWSVMARLWSNAVLQIHFKIHLSILKLKQGNLPIYKSKSSGTVKFTLYNKQEPCSCSLHKYLIIYETGLITGLIPFLYEADSSNQNGCSFSITNFHTRNPRCACLKS